MKSIVTFCFLLLAPSMLWAQMFGEQQVIHQYSSNSINSEQFVVKARELNGDGEVDLVVLTSDSVFIYQNIDGANSFVPHILWVTGNWLNMFRIEDSDNDEDYDIILMEQGLGGTVSPIVERGPPPPPPSPTKIWTMKNEGQMTFEFGDSIFYPSFTNGPPWQNTFCSSSFDQGQSVDVVSISADGVILHVNNGTTIEGFWPMDTLQTYADFTYTTIESADLDGDGDQDIIGGRSFPFHDYPSNSSIDWFEFDDGDTLLPAVAISQDVIRPTKVIAANINGDTLLDVVSSSYFDNKIAWYPNLGGGNFDMQQVVSTSADSAMDVFAIDLDNDLDIDLLSASYADNKIAWYENDGSGNFGAQQVICDTAMGARSVFAADLDNDGDLDVLSTSYEDRKVAWYENLLIVTEVEEELVISANIYPNPSSDQCTIRVNGITEIGQNVVISDVLGRSAFRSPISNNSITVNTRETGPGFFLVYLETEAGQRHFLGKLVVQ